MAQTQTVHKPKIEEASFSDARNVLTMDARRIGQMTGILIDVTTWTTESIVVRLEKAILEEMNIKKPIFRSPSVKVPVNMISSVSDVVQLNSDFTSLMGILAQLH